jgi:hypothetical protein
VIARRTAGSLRAQGTLSARGGLPAMWAGKGPDRLTHLVVPKEETPRRATASSSYIGVALRMNSSVSGAGARSRGCARQSSSTAGPAQRLPPSGARIPAITAPRMLFPAPFRPITPTCSPRNTDSERAPTATIPRQSPHAESPRRPPPSASSRRASCMHSEGVRGWSGRSLPSAMLSAGWCNLARRVAGC